MSLDIGALMNAKIQLTGLHLLITYQCTFECDHCFVWSSPWQKGTMTLKDVKYYIDQARDIESIEWIYFEGGEPFLYYPILTEGVDYAHKSGFKIGIVTNGYWANDPHDAILWLKPIADKIDDLSVSTDLFHYDVAISEQSKHIQEICKKLDLSIGFISIAQAEGNDIEENLMYRGRAAEKLTSGRENTHFVEFTECPYENLSNPSRFHLDPLGYLHICQGIVAGNILESPLVEIIKRYDPLEHPIIGSLIQGGPLKLAQDYDIPTRQYYADACQMCYETRLSMRAQSNQYLQPDQVYGIF